VSSSDALNSGQKKSVTISFYIPTSKRQGLTVAELSRRSNGRLRTNTNGLNPGNERQVNMY